MIKTEAMHMRTTFIDDKNGGERMVDVYYDVEGYDQEPYHDTGSSIEVIIKQVFLHAEFANCPEWFRARYAGKRKRKIELNGEQEQSIVDEILEEERRIEPDYDDDYCPSWGY